MPEGNTNGYDGDELGRYLDSIDREDDELASLKGSYMQECRGPRSRIKDTMLAAKEAGVNMVAFREVLKKHRALRQIEGRIEDLEADDRDAFELMQEALGEFGTTPLGKAALDRVRPDDDEALDSLHA